MLTYRKILMVVISLAILTSYVVSFERKIFLVAFAGGLGLALLLSVNIKK